MSLRLFHQIELPMNYCPSLPISRTDGPFRVHESEQGTPATSCATLGSQVGAISRLRRPGDHRWPEAPRWYIAQHGLVSRPTSDEAPDDACRLLRKPCWTAYRRRNQLALLGFEASDRPGLQLCRFYINQPVSGEARRFI